MKKTALILLTILTLPGCGDPSSNDQKVSSSKAVDTIDTRRGDHVDTYFGVEVADPYRWLEDDLSDETAAWIGDQNRVTRDYLADIAIRDDVKETVARLINFEREGAPFVAGDNRYVYRNSGLQNQSILYRVAEDGSETVFLDPNGFSDDGTVSMSGVSFTEDGSKVAYQLSVGGSDWRSIVVRDVASGEVIETPLEDVKFSGISWLGNEGFFYSSYDKPDGSELSAKTDQHKLYFHKIGTPQSEDELVLVAQRSKSIVMWVQMLVAMTATYSSAPLTQRQVTSFSSKTYPRIPASSLLSLPMKALIRSCLRAMAKPCLWRLTTEHQRAE